MHPTQEILNRCLWLTGLLLQLILLVLLVARREAGRFPVFTLLLGFYTVRTTLLYSLSGHLAGATFGLLYGWLSWADLLLQVLVAAEIAGHIVRQGGGWTWRLGGIFLLFLVLAGCGSWLAGVLVPSYPRIGIDRGQIFTAGLMFFLFGWALWRSASGPVRSIAAGFAIYGAAGLLAEAARIHAFLHRSAYGYLAWSYVPAVVYLGIVVFWVFTVRAAGRKQRGTEASVPEPAAKFQ